MRLVGFGSASLSQFRQRLRHGPRLAHFSAVWQGPGGRSRNLGPPDVPARGLLLFSGRRLRGGGVETGANNLGGAGCGLDKGGPAGFGRGDSRALVVEKNRRRLALC
jgi:hypothetical protein